MQLFPLLFGTLGRLAARVFGLPEAGAEAGLHLFLHQKKTFTKHSHSAVLDPLHDHSHDPVFRLQEPAGKI